jgi:hypothetical protein
MPNSPELSVINNNLVRFTLPLSNINFTLSNGLIELDGRCFKYEWWRKFELE